MGKGTKRLTDAWLKRASISDGIHSDGDGLYLRVQNRGVNKSWFYIYKGADGRRREMGLGSGRTVSLAAARKRAGEARELLNDGVDPIAERRKVVVAPPSFAEACEEWIVVMDQSGRWGKDAASRYRGYVKNWVGKVGERRVDEIATADVVKAVGGEWGSPTGAYVRSMIERVLDFGRVKYGLEDRPNAARYRGHIEHVLPGVRKPTKHHAALDWKLVPRVYRRLREMGREGDVGAWALTLMILGGFRQREVRELRWGDVRDDRIVIPASRYKTRKEHVVPLSKAALFVLDEVACGSNRDPDALVFAGRLEGRPLSSHTFEYLLRSLGVECKPHGFRTSFAVWCVEAGGFTDEIAQRCLGHVVGTAVSRAYQRSDFFEQKRACLEAWGEFVSASKA